jgi:hypothetical protein
MAQPPFKVDALQFGATTARRIVIVDGEITFIDDTFTDGLNLGDMVGAQTFPNMMIVGSGGGARWTSIQDALDEVPADAAFPYTILIYPGTYAEPLIISKPVCLVAVGRVVVTNSTDDPTITIIQGDDSIPTYVVFQGLEIVAEADGAACVSVDGSNTYATGTFTVAAGPLSAGDTLQIGGVALTAVSTGRTSGQDNFDGRSSSTAALAAEIVAAINDVNNGFTNLVAATLDGSDVVLTAVTPGVDGNAIEITSSTVNVEASGATLAGGGGLNSLVASQGVFLEGCTVRAEGVGGYQILCDTVGLVQVRGGSFAGSSSTSSVAAVQTASLVLEGVTGVTGVTYSYDTAEVEPYLSTVGLTLRGLTVTGDLTTYLEGAGTAQFLQVVVEGDVAAGGNREWVARSSQFSALSLEDSVQVKLINSPRNTVTATPGATLAESSWLSSVDMDGTSVVAGFDAEQPDTNYAVLVEQTSSSGPLTISAKSETGFDIHSDSGHTGTVWFQVVRRIN